MAARKTVPTDEWKREALQLRANHEEVSQQMADFVKLFDSMLPNIPTQPNPKLALCSLALHHLAMNFHTHAGIKAHKLLHKSCIFALPASFGFGDKRHDKLRQSCKEDCVCKESC
jgi:hypothetical protein